MNKGEQAARIGRARNFLVSGVSICPYAKRYASQTSFGYLQEAFDTEDALYPILDLAKRPEIMVAVYVFDFDLASHDLERARSICLFKGMFKALYLEEHGQQTESFLQEIGNELDEAFSPKSRINPFMSYQEQPFFSIAMNPVYEPQHPRWSPVSMVVATRHSDVATAPEPIVKAIRNEMKKRTGSFYDADQLYLMP
ncbi:MAG: hypothetical protein HY514_01620 [Candidatus Aenigmarchaeota archaeon]|nr:hypothetical protein [Candidatus Aenigmarchaeota archaeon]